jgi:DNA invertase Pin-like site-specific DNA recombinase
MFREAMKGQAGRPKTGSNPTLLEKDRGKAYTLTRLQKDNPEEEAKKASRSARAAEMVKAGTHTQAEAARELGVSKQAVNKAISQPNDRLPAQRLTQRKPPQPTIKLADPHRTAANIYAKIAAI